MKNFFPDSPATRRRAADEPEVPGPETAQAGPAPTAALPEAVGPGPWHAEDPTDGGHPARANDPGDSDGWDSEGWDSDGWDSEGLPAAEHEPFVPKPGYVMGRSTKVLVGVLLVAGGMFAGSVVQKQVDVGDRAARISNFQGPGAGTGAGTPSPGQGRRNGGNGSGAPTGAPAGAPTGAPAPAAGQ